jgi:hypothetical protein
MTLSFNRLGQFGRLGNQMFQYAALKGIAHHRGMEFAIPFSPELDDWQDHQLSKYFKLDSSLRIESINSQNERWESHFHFDQTLFETCEDRTDLMGYFQTDKYFSHIRDEILNDFTIKQKFEKPMKEYIALHVRRGDYINQPQFHPVCSTEYYFNALDNMPSLPVVVMSDDIEWCEEYIPGSLYLKNTSNIHDLYVMSQANHNIIANSSFSWWGAWLNQNPDKIVVAPQRWFGEAYSHYNMQDIRPEDWIQL